MKPFERLVSADAWRRQPDTYERLGQALWAQGTMPWRATTCTWTANFEADLICAFELDARRLGWLDENTPLTVWDVGAGTGRLAFHLARKLQSRGTNFRVVMTDVARSNVAAWHRQPQLHRLMEAGALQTGVMNVLTDEAPRDLETGAPIAIGPAVILAHYLFDSLPHSAWRREGGELQEGWVAENTDGTFEWAWRPATSPPLHVPTAAAHLFPDGAVTAIDRFSRLTDGRFALLAIDKGLNTEPTLARHETISAGVNFEALAEATPSLHWLDSNPSSTLQVAAAIPPQLRDSTLTRVWRPPNLVQLLERVVALRDGGGSIHQVLELQRALHHDPDTLVQLAPLIHAQLPTASLSQVEAIVATIARAADRHFILRQRLDVPFELGAMAHACGALRLAESLYLSAVAESGETPASLYNLALIMRSTDRAEYGQALIARVLELDPEHDRARKLLGGT